MSDRITESMLSHAIDRLNNATNNHYTQNNAYGYSQLAIKLPNTTGISNRSLGNTKKELYYQIQFALDILSDLKNPRYDMNLCTHKDLIRDYDNKKSCLSCDKELE